VHDAVVRTFGRPRSFPSLNAADAYVRRAIASIFIDRVRSRRRWPVV
jgi:DNA-directed RNA polymerase specialized sigma24 family protein